MFPKWHISYTAHSYLSPCILLFSNDSCTVKHIIAWAGGNTHLTLKYHGKMLSVFVNFDLAINLPCHYRYFEWHHMAILYQYSEGLWCLETRRPCYLEQMQQQNLPIS